MHRMNTTKFIDAQKDVNMCFCFHSSQIPLQLSSLSVDTNVGSDNCMTEPGEKSKDVGHSSA